MENKKITIICPGCQREISIDDALSFQLEQELKSKIEGEQQKKFELEKEQIKREAWAKAQSIAKANEEKKVKLLEEELEQQKKRRAEAEEAEIKIRREKLGLEEAKKSFEVEKQRQLDAERAKIEEKTAKSIAQEHHLKDAEKDKQMSDMRRQIEELRRKAEQGSQQTQGEVLELELEELLRAEFPIDQIAPVPKGINGADIIQTVHDQAGRDCGSIAWELKRTKAWSENWVQKLKDDQRKIRADIAILISAVLPEDIVESGLYHGVYVATPRMALGLARMLRYHIIRISGIAAVREGRSEKKEVIYNYLCGAEFRGRVEAIVEASMAMKETLEREKRAYTKIWSEREKLIERVEGNMIGLYGDMQGIAGRTLPVIKSLELDSGEEEPESITAKEAVTDVVDDKIEAAQQLGF